MAWIPLDKMLAHEVTLEIAPSYWAWHEHATTSADTEDLEDQEDLEDLEGTSIEAVRNLVLVES